MIRLLWVLSIHTRIFMRRWMPTNIILDLIRTRDGLKFGVPAMLLAIPYLFAAHWCTGVIADGGPGWINLVVLWCMWNSMKFIFMGPVSVFLLLRCRWREAKEARSTRRATRVQPTAVPSR